MYRQRYCIICGQCAESNIRLFNVPKDINQRQSWIESCGKTLTNGTLVCSRHFPPEDIGRKKLRKGALPSVCSCQAVATALPDITHNVLTNSSRDEECCHTLFHLIMSGKIIIRLPPNWGLHKLKEHILLSKMILDASGSFQIDRFVAITESDIQARIHNEIIKYDNNMRTDVDLQEFINMVNNYDIYEGNSNS